MKYNLLTFRDLKAGFYLPPMPVANINVTLRDIQALINQKPENAPPWANYPHDFELFSLGTWDSDTATFELYNKPEHIISLSTLQG